ncbi:MAG: hypothetical protein AAB534_00845 [Patescibacteria group bacterium]
MKIKKSGKGGFIKLIILIIIGLAILKLVWNINISDIIDFLNKPQVKMIWEALWGFLKMVWEFVTNLFTKN